MSRSLSKAIKNVEKFKDQIRDETSDALDDSMEDVERTMKWHLSRQDAVASGTLRDSIEAYTTRAAGKEYAKSQIHAASYWPYVEFGTGLYTSPERSFSAPEYGPPIEPILEWVQQKGISPDPDGPAETQEDLAYAIRASLKTGTQSNPFARPAWREGGREHVSNSVGNALEDALHKSF